METFSYQQTSIGTGVGRIKTSYDVEISLSGTNDEGLEAQ